MSVEDYMSLKKIVKFFQTRIVKQIITTRFWEKKRVRNRLSALKMEYKFFKSPNFNITFFFFYVFMNETNKNVDGTEKKNEGLESFKIWYYLFTIF